MPLHAQDDVEEMEETATTWPMNQDDSDVPVWEDAPMEEEPENLPMDPEDQDFEDTQPDVADDHGWEYED
jgi:hypothetical protein